jgi:hypothetical protein
VDRLQYRCPVHGVIISWPRDDPEPPKIPLFCEKKVGRKVCGKKLLFGLHQRNPTAAGQQ